MKVQSMTPDEQYLAIANVLLDGLTAYDDALGESPENDAALRLALSALGQHDAVRVTDDDETGELHVDVSPLVIASMTLLSVLARQVALGRDVDRDAVVHLVREHLETEIWPAS